MTKKGYGKHSFLNEYILENKCRKILEIGVANGDNAKNMIETAKENYPSEKIEYYGFDRFSKYSQKKEVEKKLSKTNCKFELYKGDSTNSLPQNIERLPKMDLIFIDGGHEYQTVKSDWENSKKLMKGDTGTFFHNYNFSGPKRVVDNISKEKFSVDIPNPPADYKSALVNLNESG